MRDQAVDGLARQGATLMIGGRARDEMIRDGWGLLGRVFTLPMPVVTACTGYRPQEALAAGFLHRVVAPSALLDAAVAEARALSARPAFRREKEERVGPIAERMRRRLAEDLALIERIGA